METYNTVAIQTDINGVDSNEELTALFAKALELCQTAKTAQGICCSSSSSTEFLLYENGIDSTNVKAEMDDLSMQDACVQIKQEITDAMEEALRVVETNGESFESELDEEELSTSHLDKHVTTCSADEELKCFVCDEVCESQEGLNQHVKTHEGQAATQDNLEQDSIQEGEDMVIMKNQSRKKQYICPYCNKHCHIAVNLKKHVRIHTKEKLFPCPYCDKTFTTAAQQQIHTRRYLGIKPYKCSCCDKSFVTLAERKVHLQAMHTGKKRYKCDSCGKLYAQKSNLDVHLQTHTGERPFKCDICDKTFRVNFHLVNHLRNHTGERPFKCDICDQAFTMKNYLARHLITHTGERSHQCQLCGKSFKQRSVLQRHLKTHFKESLHHCR